MSIKNHRPLRDEEIRQLTAQGCTATDWAAVLVTDPFLPDRIAQVDFVGRVHLGRLDGEVPRNGAVPRPCGIRRARIRDCLLGDHVSVSNVGGHLAGYRVADRVLIEGVGVVEARDGARFGNGVAVAALNEAGGREVTLFNGLSSQFAYLQCLHRHDAELSARLDDMARRAAEAAGLGFGTIGEGAWITGVPKIVDVAIGPSATIEAALSLVNGTVLSHPDAPTVIGEGVIARDFIVAEGASVTGGAHLRSTFVGQGSRVGSQFSSENSLFFANCEAFHGESCSVLAGPYTVTHHKSTLLIGGLFSFYNAGSGTNQSNHRYKLGPTHEGKLERGCKTGSFAYLMWPCRVGPFSVVLGKHTRSFDTADLPFSHLEADAAGKCELIPGHYIATVGTLRDGSKWPARDRRSAPERRDVLCFDVFSPLTVGRMLRGADRLERLQESTERTVAVVNVDGAEIKRVLLRIGAKRYAGAVERYLLEQIFLRLERGFRAGARSLPKLFAAHPMAVHSREWADVGGQLMPRIRLEGLCRTIAAGGFATAETLLEEFARIGEAYEEDTWLWARHHAASSLGIDLDRMDAAGVDACVSRYCELQGKFLRLVLLDAEREFDQASRVGFGMDGGGPEAERDFAAVRGDYEGNAFVRQVSAEVGSLQERCEAIRARVAETAPA